MLGLLPLLALLLLGVGVVLWAGALFLQGYIYSEPVEQIYWRAPLAALIVTVFVGFWCSLDYKSPGRYGSLLDVAGVSDNTRFDKFWSIRRGQEILYTLRKDARGRPDYYDAGGKKWNRSDTEGIMEAVVVEEKGGQTARFQAELAKDGTFKLDPDYQVARYVEVGGKRRVMREDAIGQLSEARGGIVALNLFLNVLHLIVWFLCLWLLLRFQWGHALGLAFVAWLALTFFLPPLFKKTEDLARQKALQATQGSLLLPPGPVQIYALDPRGQEVRITGGIL